MSRAPWCILLLVGCTNVQVEGTSVGNPTEMSSQLAENESVSVNRASMPVGSTTFLYSDGTWERFSVEQTLNLVEGDIIDFPDVEWTQLIIETDGLMQFEVTSVNDQVANIELDVPTISLVSKDQPVLFQEGRFVLENAHPGWLDELFEESEVEVLEVSPYDVEHYFLAKAVRDGTALFEDLNGDGSLSESERRDGRKADSGDRAFEEEERDEEDDEDDESGGL